MNSKKNFFLTALLMCSSFSAQHSSKKSVLETVQSQLEVVDPRVDDLEIAVSAVPFVISEGSTRSGAFYIGKPLFQLNKKKTIALGLRGGLEVAAIKEGKKAFSFSGEGFVRGYFNKWFSAEGLLGFTALGDIKPRGYIGAAVLFQLFTGLQVSFGGSYNWSIKSKSENEAKGFRPLVRFHFSRSLIN